MFYVEVEARVFGKQNLSVCPSLYTLDDRYRNG